MEDLQPVHVTCVSVQLRAVLPVAALPHCSIGAELLLGLTALCSFSVSSLVTEPCSGASAEEGAVWPQ